MTTPLKLSGRSKIIHLVKGKADLEVPTSTIMRFYSAAVDLVDDDPRSDDEKTPAEDWKIVRNIAAISLREWEVAITENENAERGEEVFFEHEGFRCFSNENANETQIEFFVRGDDLSEEQAITVFKSWMETYQ